MSHATITPVTHKRFGRQSEAYLLSCPDCKWVSEVREVRLAEAIRDRHECRGGK